MIKLRPGQKFLGLDELTVLNVHIHPNTAKRAQGFAQGADAFWHEMDYIVRSYDPCIIAGDFNMGLFEVITLLEQRQVRLSLLSFFPWRVKGVTTPSTDVEQNDGIPFHVPDEAMRFDSMGIFSTRLFQEVHQRHLQVDWILRGQRHNLPEFEDQQKVQGHPAIRYRGGWKSIEHHVECDALLEA